MTDAPLILWLRRDLRRDPLLSKRTDEAMWRLSVILPITQFRRYTPERTAAIQAVLAREHIRPNSTPIKVGKSALYDWLTRYEKDGIIAVWLNEEAAAHRARKEGK